MERDELAERPSYIVLEAGPTLELRARRTRDGVRLETWTIGEVIDVPAEALAQLHALAERR